MEVFSPLTRDNNIELKSTYPVNKITANYKKKFNVDVSTFFSKKEISVYKCVRTNYIFYHPFDLEGDGQFYEELQRFPWYYMPWKWEHEKTRKLLNEHEKILEVGSGNNGFIEQLTKDGFAVTGLEINEQSLLSARKKKLSVFGETIQKFAKKNSNLFDVVCSFQVLEHISDVHSFLQAKINCLKKGGKLIISVPNNDSFIKFSEDDVLNMPPHHMGLWNTSSLINLTKIFPLKVENLLYEPLQEYHFELYKDIYFKKIIKNRFLKYVLKKIFSYSFSKYLREESNKIHGHSILAVFKKV